MQKVQIKYINPRMSRNLRKIPSIDYRISHLTGKRVIKPNQTSIRTTNMSTEIINSTKIAIQEVTDVIEENSTSTLTDIEESIQQLMGLRLLLRENENAIQAEDPNHELLESINTSLQSIRGYVREIRESRAKLRQLAETKNQQQNTDGKKDALLFAIKDTKRTVDDLIKEFKKESDVPVILFTRGGGNWLPLIIESGCDCIGLDWTVDINHAKSLVGNNIVLQGNLDPCALHGDERSLRCAAKKVLEGYGEGHRHIFNLGHGIDQFVNPDNVNLLVEILKEESPAFHQN